MTKKLDETEKQINRKLADLRSSLKSKKAAKLLPTTLVLNRELVIIYELMKEIHTKALPMGEIALAMFALTLSAFLYGFFIYVIFKALLNPFVSWLINTWKEASPEGQILILLTLMGGVWAIFKWWYKNRRSSREN